VASKKFTRKIEDFVCEHCGKLIKGNGYTNHCPFCLWSKHVDINPGDRKSPCQGIMKPIRIEKSKKGMLIIHQCQKCLFKKRNKVAKEDNFDEIIRIQKT
jgi:hypothetical protein